MPEARAAGADRKVGVSRSAERDREIRALRPAAETPGLDFWRPQEVVVERERRRAAPGEWYVETTATAFLTGAECGFTCVFCDLWRYTRAERTPVGAIPAQIESARRQLAGEPIDRLKLYNASNFFDARAVPPADDNAIAVALRGVENVTVECHPRLVKERCFRFAEQLEGALEVALGVETVHPQAHSRLNKGCTLEQTWEAARSLVERGIAWRAFLLLGVPFVPRTAQLEWLRRSVDRLAEEGAACVSLVPLRMGNGALERLQEEGDLEAFGSAEMERAFEELVGDERLVVQMDPWDLELHLECEACRALRTARIERMNLSGRGEAPVVCDDCGGPDP